MTKIKGLDKLLAQLNDLPVQLENKIEAIIQDNSLQLVRSAKRFAPVDTGELRQSINAARKGELNWRVYVSAKHGPFIEFGTGGLVRVPPELIDLALQFKGRGVKEINIRPQPFLYPAFELQRDLYIADLRNLLNTEINKLNG